MCRHNDSDRYIAISLEQTSAAQTQDGAAGVRHRYITSVPATGLRAPRITMQAP